MPWAPLFTRRKQTLIVMTDMQQKQYLSIPVPPPLGPPAGMEVWYKADDIALPDTTPIALWPDASPNARDLDQPTAGQQWIYRTAIQNGLPVARATGVDKWMELPPAYTLNRGSYTAHFAINYTPGIAGDMPMFVTQSLNGGINLGLLDTDPGETVTYFFSNTPFNPGVASAAGWQVVSFVIDEIAATGEIYRDGVLIFAGAYNLDVGEVDISWLLGTYFSGYGGSFQGDIGEVLLYAVAHNAADRQQAINYLTARWL